MNILVIDDVHRSLIEGLEDLGHRVAYEPNLGRDKLCETIGQYEGLVVRSKTPIDQHVLSYAVQLKFIGRAGAGLDIIDEQECHKRGIICFNSGEANADAVGEQTIAMLLALYTNLIRADRQVRSGIWDREGNRGLELKGSTVGIIGYGNTGKAFARKLKGFEVQILAYDKYLKQYSDDYAKESNMEEIYAQCDAISFHVPLTDETRYLGNSGYFESFAKPIKVLNLSRGKVVRLQDLVSMMKIGKVSGAALDVFENEQIGKLSETEQAVFDELIHSGKTVLTPHIGGWTVESYKKISLVLLQKIKELTGGNGS